ncbi:hypothetical protein K4F52_009985 [Lecanicillium sp. MT-2017a]|nr:hypothetical protein K4F52_009985 [Lecanicillium sp. MT-2017a]
MTEQSFALFEQPHEKDLARYPEPPQSIGVYNSTSLDMSIAGDAYGAFSRTSSAGELYPNAAATTLGSLSPTIYADGAPNYIFNNNSSSSSSNNRTSPGLYPDDGDMRLSSSGLSSASAPSATSSVVGSPQSHAGPLGVPDWNNQGLGMQPGIVNNDYMAGSEYPAFSGVGVEDIPTFEFTHAKSFVERAT